MKLSFSIGAQGKDGLQVLWEDGERVLCRGSRVDGDGGHSAALAVQPVAERPTPATLERLTHEYDLRDELDAAWAARPLALVREGGRTALLLEDPGGEPLERLVGEPMEAGRFLRLATGIAAAIGKAHQRGLVHKDVKPANILVNCADGGTRLTGFGIASRLPREHQAAEPPEVIAGTLAYMAPEQTGRMNRSIDSRSDLYALGVTFYQMLTGRLPFSAADPMEWVHCHIARKPVPPSERLNSVPAVLSEIVMKLLAKAAEDRYQTAAGLEHDLRRSLAEWERHGRIVPFALGERDQPDRLMILEKLYGREREIETLVAAFDRVVESGAPELVLVSGNSGIGKSSVVNELQKALAPPRGLFASGKFDQLNRDIPYATLAQAFQGLIRPLLGKSDVELGSWRAALFEALGPNGELMVTLIPELEPLIGPQPPAPELPPQDAQRRFHLVFRRLLGVFARPEHPLALFLDAAASHTAAASNAAAYQRSRLLADGNVGGAGERGAGSACEEPQVCRGGDQNPRRVQTETGDAQRRSPRSAHDGLARLWASGRDSNPRRSALLGPKRGDRRLCQRPESRRDAARQRRRPCRSDRLEVGQRGYEGFRHRQLPCRTHRRDRRPGRPRQPCRA